jgi:hypothetical protein
MNKAMQGGAPPSPPGIAALPAPSPTNRGAQPDSPELCCRQRCQPS